MKNIFIFGSGRSGTSMLAGVFSKAGYHMGENLYPPREANPKGFFESGEINQLNEEIIRNSCSPGMINYFIKKYNSRLRDGQLWLANLPPSISFQNYSFLEDRIRKEISKKPFCYKDPRFCYTYPIWKKFLQEHVCLIIFRSPAKTIESIIKEVKTQDYLKSYSPNTKILNKIWVNQYRNILNYSESNFLFMHYDQIFEKDMRNKLKEFTGCKEVTNFPEKLFDRSSGSNIKLSIESKRLYIKLCELARFSIN